MVADTRDAEDAIRELDGRNGWRVEMARPSRRDMGGGFGGGRGGGRGCFNCELKLSCMESKQNV